MYLQSPRKISSLINSGSVWQCVIFMYTAHSFWMSLTLILLRDRNCDRFIPTLWESAIHDGSRSQRGQFHRRMRSRRVSHTCWRCYTFYDTVWKENRGVRARTKLRNYRRLAGLLLGRYMAFARVREWEIESNQLGKWRVKLQWR